MGNLRDEVLSAIPVEAHPGILKMALDHNITDPTDPQWGMVGLAWAATRSVDLARAALDAVDQHIRSLPDQIHQSAARAGEDLRSALGQEVQKRGVELGAAITAAIKSAADSGATMLRQAAADLPTVAAANQGEIIKEWRASLASAAKDEARGALSARMARSWGMVVISLVLAFAAGAGGALAGARLTGMLLLHDVFVMPRPAGGQMVIFPPGRQVRQLPAAADCPGGDVCIGN